MKTYHPVIRGMADLEMPLHQMDGLYAYIKDDGNAPQDLRSISMELGIVSTRKAII